VVDNSYSLPTEYKFKRKDSDLALNYRLNDYFKVFVGAKYLGFSHSAGADFLAFGPGLGLSATFPITDNIFLLANLSGFYLWGEHKGSGNKYDYNQYGINSTLSLAYYIAPASTTVSLGGRFQRYKHVYELDYLVDGDVKFYGITLTATYSFSI